MKRMVFVLGMLLIAHAASAQSITAYPLKIYNVGATTPLSTTDLLAANVVCNQAPPTTTSTIDPTKVIWDDEANAGRLCIWTDPGTGPLASLPFGALTYEAT